jgi:hypothetical protein
LANLYRRCDRRGFAQAFFVDVFLGRDDGTPSAGRWAITAWAAARRAIGTRNGEQDT